MDGRSDQANWKTKRWSRSKDTSLMLESGKERGKLGGRR
jgi:hypothetical protein